MLKVLDLGLVSGKCRTFEAENIFDLFNIEVEISKKVTFFKKKLKNQKTKQNCETREHRQKCFEIHGV